MSRSTSRPSTSRWRAHDRETKVSQLLLGTAEPAVDTTASSTPW